jgi:hypothetical protein
MSLSKRGCYRSTGAGWDRLTPQGPALLGSARSSPKHEADDLAESLRDEGDVVRVMVPMRIPARRDGTHGELEHEADDWVRVSAASSHR